MSWCAYQPKSSSMPLSFIRRSSSRSSSIDDDSISSEENPSPPSIAAIYSHADAYEKVLASHQYTVDTTNSDPDVVEEPVSGYTHLVANDLTPDEQADVDKARKLSVSGTTWTPGGELTEEPETYSDDSASERTAIDLERSPVPAFHRTATTDSDAWKLEPAEIVRLLVDEFGPLAAEGEKPEKLIFEADGCMFNGVVIVGVLHVTTHRLAFHASLLPSDDAVHSGQKVIKAGSVTIHRKGWRTKRRLWIELSADMMTTCASSSEEDRIRPLRTVLLSNIKDVLPHDPDDPCSVHIVFDHLSDDSYDYAEFDTTEAAQEWRRELLGAIFLFRHRRREVMDVTTTDSGIRLSCPLDRITKFVSRRMDAPGFHFSTIHVQCNEACGLTIDDHAFHLSPIMHIPAWKQMDDFIATAKARHPDVRVSKAAIVADFGPLSMMEAEAPHVSTDHKERTIRTALGLDGETDLWIIRARIFRSISSSGYFTISSNYISFWSKQFASGDIRYRLPIAKIKNAKTFRTFPVRLFGLTLELNGQPDLKFQFKTTELRDEAMRRINTLVITRTEQLRTPPSPGKPSMINVFSPPARTVAVAKAAEIPFELRAQMPKVINLDREIVNARPSLHFMCLTIGSRGDVQPYISLGLGLMKEGHRVTIVTHEEYKEWIEGFGIRHRQAGGDPGALMKLSVENKMFSPEFFKESLAHFRPWLDQLLLDSWESCQGADVLLESPSAMAGVHIAEALNIPYFRTFTMPWTKTAEFPHAFLSPPVEYSTFNSASYVLFSNVMWTATSRQINKWRRHTLKLGNTDMGHLAQSKIPFIYNFSTAVVPKPLDWSDTICVSGYWFLDNPDLNWEPPADLLTWMDKARADGKPIVYIGFGSITVPHPNRVTTRIIKAVLKSDVRAIISKGWSARMSHGDDSPEPEIPPECYQLDKIPHDWLFPKIDAAMHHGGAGTTGASLRAGIPTLIKPWFGDQFFWASRVQKLGAGLRVPSLRVNDLAEALTKATTSRIMKEKAAGVGEKIRSEDGVKTAIHNIYTYLPRASREQKTLKTKESTRCHRVESLCRKASVRVGA
ncbi:glycosyltransferase family 1 protein [Armillaria fumosa]|nr:glycosyltransferase family 1 protein [Armillaria fumosa]